MDMTTIFSLSSLLVMPFWFLMAFLPRWRWTQRIINSPLVVAPAALLYVILILPQTGSILAGLVNPTLPGVMALLATPAGATVAWVHFLAFDLFVGRWVYLDSQQKNISPWVMAPALFLVLMIGPAGYLAYMGLRGLWQQRTGGNIVRPHQTQF